MSKSELLLRVSAYFEKKHAKPVCEVQTDRVGVEPDIFTTELKPTLVSMCQIDSSPMPWYYDYISNVSLNATFDASEACITT